MSLAPGFHALSVDARGAAMRLALARCTAWALLIGGWLALGALGRQHAAQAAAGLAPVALWLAALGLCLSLAARRVWSPAALRCALAGAGLATAAGGAALAGPAPGLGLGVLVVGWSLLLVAVSLAVRLLRRGMARPPTPALPALSGTALAWAWAGDAARWLAAPASQGLLLAGAAVLLALLLPRRAAAVSACRSGLFDCALALAPLATWRRPGAWPQAAAALAMLPMMATLAAMADWCGSGPSALGSSAAHLGAMLLPALLCRAWGACGPAFVAPGKVAAVTAALLVAGGLALAWPGLNGLMAAGLLQGLAWGCAWAARLSAPADPYPARRAPQDRAATTTAGPAGTAAALVLGLGVALAQWGPAALAAVHAALAVLGGLGGLALAWQQLVCLAGRRDRPRHTVEA